MTSRIEASALTAKKRDGLCYKSSKAAISVDGLPGKFLEYGRVLLSRVPLLVSLCLIIWSAASTVYAQDLGGFRGFAPAFARFTGSFSARETHEFAGAPHLVISMAEPDHFGISEAPQRSSAQPNEHQPYERVGDSIVYSGRFALAHEVLETTYHSPINSRPLNPESILSVVEAKYMRWESSLADSRSLTNVNGALVYPLVQINSGDWHLPITLNTAPAPGGETR